MRHHHEVNNVRIGNPDGLWKKYREPNRLSLKNMRHRAIREDSSRSFRETIRVAEFYKRRRVEKPERRQKKKRTQKRMVSRGASMAGHALLLVTAVVFCSVVYVSSLTIRVRPCSSMAHALAFQTAFRNPDSTPLRAMLYAGEENYSKDFVGVAYLLFEGLTEKTTYGLDIVNIETEEKIYQSTFLTAEKDPYQIQVENPHMTEEGVFEFGLAVDGLAEGAFYTVYVMDGNGKKIAVLDCSDTRTSFSIPVKSFVMPSDETEQTPGQTAQPSGGTQTPGPTAQPSAETQTPGQTAQPSGETQTPGPTAQPSGETQTPGQTAQPSGETQTPGQTAQPSAETQTPGQTAQPSAETQTPRQTAQPSGETQTPGQTAQPSGETEAPPEEQDAQPPDEQEAQPSEETLGLDIDTLPFITVKINGKTFLPRVWGQEPAPVPEQNAEPIPEPDTEPVVEQPPDASDIEWVWDEEHTEVEALIPNPDNPEQPEIVRAEVTETVAKEPGCEEEGLAVYTASVPGEDGTEYSDVQTAVIPAKGHTYERVKLNQTQSGTSAEYVCPDCGKSYSIDVSATEEPD